MTSNFNLKLRSALPLFIVAPHDTAIAAQLLHHEMRSYFLSIMCSLLLATRSVAARSRTLAFVAHRNRPFTSSSFQLQATQTQATTTTVAQVTQDSIAWLQARNVPEPEGSVYHLLAFALNLDWSDGFVQLQNDKQAILQDRLVTTDEQATLQIMLNRRATMEPLQYILGQWDFLDYTLLMQAPLLCPRPETEELVLHVERDIKQQLQIMKEANNDKQQQQQQQQQHDVVRILDIGCGTGAIGIALCDRLMAATHVTALDIEPIAITVSNQNAQRILMGGNNNDNNNNNQYHAELCDIANYNNGLLFDMVVSNPPYIPRTDMSTLSDDVVNYESDTALCGGPDGLDVVRLIIDKLPTLCAPGAPCWMEVDPSHPTLIQHMLDNNTKVDYHSTVQDMFGQDRFVKLVVR